MPSVHDVHRRVLLSAGILFSVVLAWCIALLSNADRQGLQWAPFILIGAFIGGVVAHERHVRNLGIISGLGISLAAYFVMFSAVPITDVINGHPLIYHEAWWTAGWLSLVGVVALYGGYRIAILFAPRLSRQPQRTWSSHRAKLLGVVLFLVSLVGLLMILTAVGGVGAYLSVFRQRTLVLQGFVPHIVAIGLAIPGCLVMAGRWLHKPNAGRALTIVAVWLPLTILITGSLGARFRVATILIALLAVVHLGYRRINRVLLTTLVAAILVIFVIYGVQRNYVGSIHAAPEVNLGNLYERYLSTHDSVGEFRELLIVVESVPTQLEFQGGRTIASLLPGADFPTGGQLYSAQFFEDLYSAGTSISPSLPGELYMNFGILGVVVGMFIFGLFVGHLDEYFRRHRSRVGAVLIYAFSLFPLAMLIRGDITSMLTYYFAGVLPLIVAVRICEVRTGATA